MTERQKEKKYKKALKRAQKASKRQKHRQTDKNTKPLCKSSTGNTIFFKIWFFHEWPTPVLGFAKSDEIPKAFRLSRHVERGVRWDKVFLPSAKSAKLGLLLSGGEPSPLTL